MLYEVITNSAARAVRGLLGKADRAVAPELAKALVGAHPGIDSYNFV